MLILLAASPASAESTYTFDGFQLGTLYGSAVMSRAPYKEPCDNDPIDKKARRFMVYGALPCRERTFPEATTVLFYLRYAEPDRYEQPIVAFAWLGGNYFATRSNFPLRTGQPVSAAAEKLGAPQSKFQLERKGIVLSVHHHRGDVWTISDKNVLVGFVVGPMPEEAENEQWRALLQMYGRYTVTRLTTPTAAE